MVRTPAGESTPRDSVPLRIRCRRSLLSRVDRCSYKGCSVAAHQPERKSAAPAQRPGTATLPPELFSHVTLPEAARRLSGLLETSVGHWDVLGLALEGRLRLSVYLPVSADARCGQDFKNTARISGLCDLPCPLSRLAQSEVDRALHSMRYPKEETLPSSDDVASACEDRVEGHRVILLKAADGVVVRQDGQDFLLEWYQSLDSWVPLHGYFVVSTAALAEFELKYVEQFRANPRRSASGSSLVDERTARDWTDVEIWFVSDNMFQPVVKGQTQAPQNVAEVGLSDGRSGLPRAAWATLRKLAESGGVILSTPTAAEWPKLEKRIQEIRKVLRVRFGINSDPVPYRDGGYTARFKIGVRPSYGN